MSNKIITIPEQPELAAAPANPTAGFTKLYKSTDGNWYEVDSAGLVTKFSQLALARIYDSAGGQAVSPGPVVKTYNINALFGNTATFATSGTTGLQVLVAGDYKITSVFTADKINNSRSTMRQRVLVNGAQLAGADGYSYHRTDAVDTATSTVVAAVSLAVNDIITVEVERTQGAGTLFAVAHGSSLMVEKFG